MQDVADTVEVPHPEYDVIPVRVGEGDPVVDALDDIETVVEGVT